MNELETLVEGFAWCMAQYPVELVIRGIGEYIQTHNDIPTPADIRAIIDPVKPEWKPDWSVYNALKEERKHGGAYALSRDEIEYLAACEKWTLSNFRESN